MIVHCIVVVVMLIEVTVPPQSCFDSIDYYALVFLCVTTTTGFRLIQNNRKPLLVYSTRFGSSITSSNMNFFLAI